MASSFNVSRTTIERARDTARRIVTAALIGAFVLTSAAPSFAQTITGTLSGTVSGPNAAKLRGAAVTAVSPSQRYAATTNEAGFFSITGVVPDTYSVTINAAGYQPVHLDGVTISAGQSVNLVESLSATLKDIGRTQSRSAGSAYQPLQTQDTYTVTVDQIKSILGKNNSTDEASLLASLPGASFDSLGYPILRGGRQTEEGYQFEGINYTDAFTNQFVNSLVLHGAAQFQVTPGAGDASTGNAGTGAINVIAKRGANPHFGSFEYDLYGGRAQHSANIEYGFATPNGRFSSYTTYYKDVVSGFQYGATPSTALGQGTIFGARNHQWTADFLENAVYKFGPNANQSLQLFYNNTYFELHTGYGLVPQSNGFGLNGYPLYYKTNDLFYLRNTAAFTGLSIPQIQAVEGFTTGQRSVDQPIGQRGPTSGYQPNESFKIQYSWNINPSTFFTAKAYAVNDVPLFDNSYVAGLAFGGSDVVSLQGGVTRGLSFDVSKQLGTKHLLATGFDFKFLHPVLSQPSGTGGLYGVAGFGQGYQVADFLPNDANCPLGPDACGFLLGQLPGHPTAYITPGQRVPIANQSAQTQRQDYGFYVQDVYSPTDRIKINAGVRLDMANLLRGDCNIDLCLPTSTGTLPSGAPDPSKDRFDYDPQTRRPHVVQPRISIADQFTARDSLRFSYSRGMRFPLIAESDHTNNFAHALFGAYENVPAYNALTGGTANWCGTTFNRLCKNYADALYWADNSFFSGAPIVPLKPVTFSNFEASFQHAFRGNVAVKLTPFYRKSYDEISAAATPVIVNGKPVLDANGAPTLGQQISTNLGNSSIAGVEFYMTKLAPVGLSGSLSLTYQNAFSNVLPTTLNENFFPTVPFESLQLGNRYRSGAFSPFVGNLALSYKTRNGWRINPVVFYNRGYPIGQGLLTPFTVNGVPNNIPNTNVTNSAQLNGPAGAPQYVDPQNPGSVFGPNVAATRGAPESASPGGSLSKAQAKASISLEYTPPNHPRTTFGARVSNVFNLLYDNSSLIYTSRYQPVATGRNAPYSGYSSQLVHPEYYYYDNVRANYANLPYTFRANAIPRTVEFYYQLSL